MLIVKYRRAVFYDGVLNRKLGKCDIAAKGFVCRTFYVLQELHQLIKNLTIGIKSKWVEAIVQIGIQKEDKC